MDWKTRTTTCGALGLITALVLTGCGRDDPSQAAPEVGAELSDGPATGEITVWAMGNEGELLPEFVEAFEEENPDVTVNVTAIPWDSAHDRIANSIAGGETPDVSMVGTTWVGEFASTGAIDPNPADVVDPSAFFEGSWETTEVNGTNYGVPWYVDTRVLYYNTALAGDAGVDEPTSWDGLTSFTTGLKDAGAEQGIYLPPGGFDSWQFLLPMVWQKGGDVLAEDGSTFTLDDQAWVDALTYYKSFSEQDISTDSQLLPTGELEPAFVNGDIGSFFAAPFDVALLKSLDSPEFSVTKQPVEDAGTSFVGGANWAVFKDSENRDAAWKFVQWLSEPDVQADWYEASTDLPSVQSAWEDPVLAEDPYLSVFGEQLDDAKAPPAIPTWAQISALIDTAIEQTVKGVVTPEEAASTLQESAASIGTGS